MPTAAPRQAPSASALLKRTGPRMYTRWIFFMVSIVANLALIDAFVLPAYQRHALVFLCAIVAITGIYVRRTMRIPLRRILSRFRPDDWEEPAVYLSPREENVDGERVLTHAVWQKGYQFARYQHLEPRGLGRSRTVVQGRLETGGKGRVEVRPRRGVSDDELFERRFVVRATSREEAERRLAPEIREAIEELAFLEDPLHCLRVDFRGDSVEVAVDGSLEDDASLIRFLELSFRIIEACPA